MEVVQNGTEQEIDARNLVPGDIVSPFLSYIDLGSIK
jgi:hypothetical protein